MLLNKLSSVLKNKEFISVATCDFNGKPNAAPKFFLKIEDGYIYLIDYTIGKTWENLRINPVISLSCVDTDSLSGYQINGSVELIDSGREYEFLLDELNQKKIGLSAIRIIEGVSTGKKHQKFEVDIPEEFVVFKVKIKEIVEIGHKGELKKQILE